MPERPETARLYGAVEALLASYQQGISHVGSGILPSRSAVPELVRDLDAALFPGCFSEEDLSEADLPRFVAQRVRRLHGRLAPQVSRALRHAGAEQAAADEEGRRISLELMEALPTLRVLLQEDVDAAVRGDPAARSREEVVLSYPAVRAIATYRVAHVLHRLRVPLIPRMMTEHVHAQTGIDIHPGARIGPGLFIDHGTGVVVGETAEIGKCCKLYQGVTLGARSVEKTDEAGWSPEKRHPTLEDHVTVYAHATILGGGTVVGEGSVIGGNVWLVRSIPPNSTVQIEPPYLRVKHGRDGTPMREQLDYQI